MQTLLSSDDIIRARRFLCLFVFMETIYVSVLMNVRSDPCSVVMPSSFMYGNSIDASRFIQLEDMKCNFQPLNLTFQVLILARVLQNVQRAVHFSQFVLSLCPIFPLSGRRCRL